MGTKHRRVMAFDPGDVTGWATFWDGELQSAGTFKKGTFLNLLAGLGVIVVIEKPVYLKDKRVDPNDMITLGLWAGQLAGYYGNQAPGTDVLFVTPRRWKGTVEKRLKNERTLGALTDDERERLPRRPRAKDYDHNMLDAVGIGLWQLEKERQR